MADQALRRLFDRLDAAPTPEFEESLRRQLLELADGDPLDETVDPPTHRVMPPAVDDSAMVRWNDDAPTPGRRAIWLVVAAAAAVVAVVIGLVIAGRGGTDTVVTNTTNVPTTLASEVAPTPTTTTAPTTTAPEATTTERVATTDAAAPATTVPSGPRTTLPADVGPGEHRLETAVVPTGFTTTQPWSRVLDFPERVLLSRGTESADGELLFAYDIAPAADLAFIAGRLCPDAITLGEPVSTTLMGSEGFTVEGTTTAECPASVLGGSGFFVAPDSLVIVTAAEVDGHVVVIAADAPVATADAFRAEIEQLLASVTRL
jgi:hypothetical protein